MKTNYLLLITFVTKVRLVITRSDECPGSLVRSVLDY